ncbi:hypothetical protein MKX03_027713 [Papaver bracteatum]|nr:hypothetical protein MKX03_027713 [Papaver bracteatum]
MADETEITDAKKRKKCVDFDVHCSCKLFESKGILCRHAIVVLIRNGIRLIPEKYILRRWRKDVTRLHTKVKVSFSCWELNESSLCYNQISLKFNVLADLDSVNDEESKVVNEWLDNKIEELKAKSIELEKIKLNAEDQGDTSFPNVRNPAKKKRIGRKRSKRLKAKRSRKRTKRKPSTKPIQDIITNISDPSLNDMHVTQESVATPTPSYPHNISDQQQTEATRGRGTHGRGTRGRGTRGRGTRGRGAHGNAAQLSNCASTFGPLGMYMPVPAEAPYTNPPYVSSWNPPHFMLLCIAIVSIL